MHWSLWIALRLSILSVKLIGEGLARSFRWLICLGSELHTRWLVQYYVGISNDLYPVFHHPDLPRAHILWQSLVIRPYRPSFLASALDSIQCQHKADECKFLPVFMCCSLKENVVFIPREYLAHLTLLSWMICPIGGKWPCSSWFIGCCSGICLKQHAASLGCFSSSFFSKSVLTTTKWCNYTVVLKKLHPAVILVLFYRYPYCY